MGDVNWTVNTVIHSDTSAHCASTPLTIATARQYKRPPVDRDICPQVGVFYLSIEVRTMNRQTLEKPRRAQLSGRVPREFKNQVLNYSRWSGVPIGELMRQALTPVVTPQTRNIATATTEDKSDE